MEVIKQRWFAYLIALVIGGLIGFFIGRSTNASTHLMTTISSGTDSTSKEKSGYILDSNMTR